jgi:CHAD domain-containing protein
LEIEAKFQVPNEDVFQQLLEIEALAGFCLGAVSIANLHDRYLETKDWALQTGGYACRLRKANGTTLVTVKSLGGASGAIHRREEHQVELPEPRPPQEWPPCAAQDTVLRLCDPERLAILLEIKQVRHNRLLYDGERRVAEISLDRVCLAPGCAEGTDFFELEAELLPDGSEEDLVRLETVLQEAWGLAPDSRSKYERGLAAQIEETRNEETLPATDQSGNAKEMLFSSNPVDLLKRPGVEPDDPMSEAGRKVLRFHFQRMVYHEPGTRLGEDIEALHDMRVATRRMRAAFRVFGGQYKAKDIAPYLKGLKQTGRVLGPVRDLDVFRSKIQEHLDSLPESQRSDTDDLLNALDVQREAARYRMLSHLDSAKYGRFVEQFSAFVETPGMGSLPTCRPNGEPRPFRVRHVAPASIYQRLAGVRAYEEWVQNPSPPLARLHALRIACKRLRYTLEFFHEVLGPETKTVIKEMVAMQDHLGSLQDTVVASGILRDYLERGTLAQGFSKAPAETEPVVTAPGVSAYLASQQAEMWHLLNTFPEAWERLKGARFSQLLAKAVMVL